MIYNSLNLHEISIFLTRIVLKLRKLKKNFNMMIIHTRASFNKIIDIKRNLKWSYIKY